MKTLRGQGAATVEALLEMREHAGGAKVAFWVDRTSFERKGNSFKGFKDLNQKAKARIWPGLILALTILYVPYSIDSGIPTCRSVCRAWPAVDALLGMRERGGGLRLHFGLPTNIPHPGSSRDPTVV